MAGSWMSRNCSMPGKCLSRTSLFSMPPYQGVPNFSTSSLPARVAMFALFSLET